MRKGGMPGLGWFAAWAVAVGSGGLQMATPPECRAADLRVEEAELSRLRAEAEQACVRRASGGGVQRVPSSVATAASAQSLAARAQAGWEQVQARLARVNRFLAEVPQNLRSRALSEVSRARESRDPARARRFLHLYQALGARSESGVYDPAAEAWIDQATRQGIRDRQQLSGLSDRYAAAARDMELCELEAGGGNAWGSAPAAHGNTGVKPSDGDFQQALEAAEDRARQQRAADRAERQAENQRSGAGL